MGFLSSGIFWGTIVVIFGISMLLKAVFHIDLPVFRILLGLIVIYFGLRLITGWHGCSAETSASFSETKAASQNLKGEYNVAFGKSTIDLSDTDLSGGGRTLKLGTTFGETVILVDKNTPIDMHVDSIFSGVNMPDGNTAAMGSLVYRSPAYKEGNNCLNIKADVIFGSLRIVTKQ